MPDNLEEKALKESLKSAFLIEEKFPDPGLVFSARDITLGEIKQNCLIVIDTNVLLLPFKIRNESLSVVKEVYRLLVQEHRLFIPAQVAREFTKNRAKKLGEVYQALLDRKVKVKEGGQYPILEELEEYSELVQKEKELIDAQKAYASVIDKLVKRIKTWGWNDPVSLAYKELFSDKNIESPDITREELEKDFQRRTELKIPPGYKDASKDENPAGDLIIWHTILKLGSKFKNDLVFVSEDRKSDWWSQSGGSPFLPRYELVDEYKRLSEGRSLHLITFSEFLAEFNAPRTVVDEVRLKEEEISLKRERRVRHVPRAIRLQQLEEQGVNSRQCSVCGYLSEGNNIIEVHHIVPLNSGGVDDLSNIKLLCPNCHRAEHTTRALE